MQSSRLRNNYLVVFLTLFSCFYHHRYRIACQHLLKSCNSSCGTETRDHEVYYRTCTPVHVSPMKYGNCPAEKRQAN